VIVFPHLVEMIGQELKQELRQSISSLLRRMYADSLIRRGSDAFVAPSPFAAPLLHVSRHREDELDATAGDEETSISLSASDAHHADAERVAAVAAAAASSLSGSMQRDRSASMSMSSVLAVASGEAPCSAAEASVTADDPIEADMRAMVARYHAEESAPIAPPADDGPVGEPEASAGQLAALVIATDVTTSSSSSDAHSTLA
jgi:hypothetical protein